ncbi:hypothetical protein TFKS16_1621 [Tannerella forsythia KS16]|nr:hypothetical protein TF3313_1668 [Tannerella forsythia 3313]BAR51862.1 hypothetical protein TFKS16_1621 [Tannerella forsythia KS16]
MPCCRRNLLNTLFL